MMLNPSASHEVASDVVTLSPALLRSGQSIEDALRLRRSVREYTTERLSLAEISQLLWAAQGVTGPAGERTAPSAGALYPLELYVAAGNVEGLPAGIFHYEPRGHVLRRVAHGDVRIELAQAAFGQPCVADGAAVIVFAAVNSRSAEKYGQRGFRYVCMETGHAAQSLCLQAAVLGLGTVVIGAFDDRQVKKVMKMSRLEDPLCLMPVGRPA